jgi:hypothetical protein
MDYMKLVANAGRRPEVSFPASDIQDAIRDLSHLTGPGVPKSIHRRAVRLIGEVRDLTEDAGIRSDCVLALASLGTPAVPRGAAPAARPRPEVVSLSNTQTLVETK